MIQTATWITLTASGPGMNKQKAKKVRHTGKTEKEQKKKKACPSLTSSLQSVYFV